MTVSNPQNRKYLILLVTQPDIGNIRLENRPYAEVSDRHKQKDFFILDISDVIPKDDIASMEHPLFSLATKPDMRHLEYYNNQNRLKITPSGVGLPTIFDKDILIFCISQLIHKKNLRKPIGKKFALALEN